MSQNSGSITEYLASGTFKGLTACIEQNSPVALTEEQSRSLCSSKHAVNLTQQVSLRGQGAPIEGARGAVFFAGGVTNTHADYLITFVQIALSVFDDEGNESKYTAFGNVWATPFDDVEIEFRLSQNPKANDFDVEWCEQDVAFDDLQSCKSWEVTTVAGVPL
ncbi:MAG: hypothetical protein ABF254_00790 [Octadecabacter sp.]